VGETKGPLGVDGDGQQRRHVSEKFSHSRRRTCVVRRREDPTVVLLWFCSLFAFALAFWGRLPLLAIALLLSCDLRSFISLWNSAEVVWSGLLGGEFVFWPPR
jgi:hypothetical protein